MRADHGSGDDASVERESSELGFRAGSSQTPEGAGEPAVLHELAAVLAARPPGEAATRAFLRGWADGVERACDREALAAEIHRAVYRPLTRAGLPGSLLTACVDRLICSDAEERRAVSAAYARRYRPVSAPRFWWSSRVRFQFALLSALLSSDEEKAVALIATAPKFELREFGWLRSL